MKKFLIFMLALVAMPLFSILVSERVSSADGALGIGKRVAVTEVENIELPDNNKREFVKGNVDRVTIEKAAQGKVTVEDVESLLRENEEDCHIIISNVVCSDKFK